MNILLLGYGQMGTLLETLGKRRGHEIRSVDPSSEHATSQQLTEDLLKWADCAIDFSTPEAAFGNIQAVAECKQGCNLVMGSTGWYERESEVRELVERNSVGFMYASNFSLGVNLYFQMIRKAARIMNAFESYDVAGVEFHHNKKMDSPSGTAHSISTILLDEIDRKKVAHFDAFHRRPESDELHFASVRNGSYPGTHEVIFDSDADTIVLKHVARNREGFALGALLAAEWLAGRTGFYTMDDFMNEVLKGIQE